MTMTLRMYAQALEGWPPHLADLARPIIHEHAQEAYADMKAGYAKHRVTGTLEAGLTITDTSGPLRPSWTLENDVFYAKIFEAGGATTAGPKPAGRVFVPVAIATRRRLRRALVDLLQREGLPK